MNTTNRFKWKDRDAAAFDLLQLAYHAPLDISQLALQLLSAIRSNAVTTELTAIALDPERSDWERRLAIRAVEQTPGDTSPPVFSRLMPYDLSTRVRKRKRHVPPDYKQTTVYIKLEALYLQALNGDRTAFKSLSDYANRWNEHIITRALAAHFIGWLHPQFDVVDTLSWLLCYADDDWGTPPYYSPVRTEAGEALYRIASPQAWEALVNGFFINPRNILAGFMLIWISQLTDRLSGIHRQSSRPEPVAGDLSRCPWVNVLAKIDST